MEISDAAKTGATPLMAAPDELVLIVRLTTVTTLNGAERGKIKIPPVWWLS